MTPDFRLFWFKRLKGIEHDGLNIFSNCIKISWSCRSYLGGGLIIFSIFYLNGAFNNQDSDDMPKQSKSELADFWPLALLFAPIIIPWTYCFVASFLNNCFLRTNNELVWKIADDSASKTDISRELRQLARHAKLIDSIDTKFLQLYMPICCTTGTYNLRELANAANAVNVNKILDELAIWYRNHLSPMFTFLYQLENRQIYLKNKNVLNFPVNLANHFLSFLSVADMLHIPKEIPSDKHVTIKANYSRDFADHQAILSAYNTYKLKLYAKITETAEKKKNLRLQLVNAEGFDLESQTNINERTPLINRIS